MLRPNEPVQLKAEPRAFRSQRIFPLFDILCSQTSAALTGPRHNRFLLRVWARLHMAQLLAALAAAATAAASAPGVACPEEAHRATRQALRCRALIFGALLVRSTSINALPLLAAGRCYHQMT